MSRNFRVAVLIKQVPRVEELSLRPDGRLNRAGLDLELNPYCRRAISKGVEIAGLFDGTCTAFTLGPPEAEDALREAIACGVDSGVLLSDPQFAGSDTLATARALSLALAAEEPFDLILTGRNSVDADTGQVPPQVAELLDMPFLAGVHNLDFVQQSLIRAVCESDDGFTIAEVELPVLLSCAERLCDPAKAPNALRNAVDADKLVLLSSGDLGAGPWGAEGSRTEVGRTRLLPVQRTPVTLSGTLEGQAAVAVGVISKHLERTRGGFTRPAKAVPVSSPSSDRSVIVVVEPERDTLAREMLGAAAVLAAEIGGRVNAVVISPLPDSIALASWGADEITELIGITAEQDIATSLRSICEDHNPWAVVGPATLWGREILSRAAARLNAGLTGDAIGLEVDDGRLVSWKPAFGGSILAAVTATSAIQLVTVRPGVLELLRERPASLPLLRRRSSVPTSKVNYIRRDHNDDIERLAKAHVVVGVGAGVDPSQYSQLDQLLKLTDAELAATRKVTDRQWLPRSRQVGITGRSIGPNVYFAIGISGKDNHLLGVKHAGLIFAINSDPEAPIFQTADVGIVADWREVLPLLVSELELLYNDGGIAGE